MAFDPKMLESIKDEIRNQTIIDPQLVLEREKVKSKSPALAKLFEDLHRGSASRDNPVVHMNNAMNDRAGNTNPNMMQPHAHILESFDGVQYNAYDDSEDTYMEERIRTVENQMLMEKKNNKFSQQNTQEYAQQFAQKPQYQPTQPQYAQQYYAPPINEGYKNNNNNVRDELLELFAKDYILKIMKEYISTDPEFKKSIISIMRGAIKKKENE